MSIFSPTEMPPVVDYRRENPTAGLLPEPPVRLSWGWSGMQLAVFRQPALETAEHEHTSHAIAYAFGNGEKAEGDRWLEGKRQWEARNGGEIAIIPAGISHRCNWGTSVQFAVLAIAPDSLEAIAREWCERVELVPRFMTESDPFIVEIFRVLNQELTAAGMGSTLLADSLKTALAIHLLRHYSTRSPRSFQSAAGLSAPCLKLVTDYIQANLHRNLPLPEIAAIARISPYHFLRLFQQSLHLTPHQYILRCRLEKAKLLLSRGTEKIADIALQLGFCDQSHFSRAFKRAYGVTPKQFRRLAKQ